MNYIYTPTEDYVKKLYHHLSIFVPEQIDIIEIASKLDIWVHFEKVGSKAFELNESYSMFIDSRLTSEQQWQDFAHELCHVLMHCGNQLQLPTDFIQYQESKAKNFAYHFCVPTFMLEQLDLPARKKEAIELISKTFNVEYIFAKSRLEKWIQQKESNLFYEKIADSSAHYSPSSEKDKVIYLESDIDNLPASPEMLEEFFEELGPNGSFFNEGPITVGIIHAVREMREKVKKESAYVNEK